MKKETALRMAEIKYERQYEPERNDGEKYASLQREQKRRRKGQ